MVQLTSFRNLGHTSSKAKQKASVRWLVSKAYAHQVPEDLRDPFYRDSEDQELLKASVVHALANAELYCLALAFIYADPNYSQLNHGQVIQALIRKGVHVTPPPDVALTETTLIHTTPLRMSAHLAVMEALMTLYVKEIVTPQRIISVLSRVGDIIPAGSNPPRDPEEALLLWANNACAALKRRLAKERRNDQVVPEFPLLRELADFSDGICLLGILELYYPDSVDWNQVATNEPLSMTDCMNNFQILMEILRDVVPYEVCHFALEDLAYMHSSIRQNVLAFLADLFVALELNPSKINRSPISAPERTINPHENVKFAGIRRHASLQERERPKRFQQSEAFSQTLTRRKEPANVESTNEDFVVHRGKTVPTLVNTRDTSLNKSPEKVESTPTAGVPSNWVERKHSFSGRRSRRNSITDDSHLTVENFGGSQDNLSFSGRNPDKEPAALPTGRRSSAEVTTNTQLAGLSSTGSLGRNQRLTSQDNSLNYINQPDKDKKDPEEPKKWSLASILGSRSSSSKQSPQKEKEKPREFRDDSQLASSKATNFAEIGKFTMSSRSPGINIVYMQPERDTSAKSSRRAKCVSVIESSTWNPQPPKSEEVDMSELFQARLKMEETRKRIEAEKRHMEAVASKEREEVGKVAFLQAVARSKPSQNVDTPMSDPSEYNAFQRATRQAMDSSEFAKTPPRHQGSSYEPYRVSPHNGAISAEQLYPKSASPSRRTWGQPTAFMSPQTYNQDSGLAEMRRAHWGNPQPVQPLMGHYAVVADTPAYPVSYQGPGYVVQPVAQDPYNPYYVQRKQFMEAADPYAFNQGRTFPPLQQQMGFQTSPAAPSFRLHSEDGVNVNSGALSIQQQYGGSSEAINRRANARNEMEDSLYDSPVVLRKQRPTTERESQVSKTGPSPTSTLTRTHSLHSTPSRGRTSSGGSGPPTLHTALPTPSLDDMEPQNVSFIETPSGLDFRTLNSVRKPRDVNITSGTRTYRISNENLTSPTKNSLLRTFNQNSDFSSYQRSLSPKSMDKEEDLDVDIKLEKLKDDVDSQKGFVITFDEDSVPKKTKPQLGRNRSISSPKRTAGEYANLKSSNSYDVEDSSPRRSLTSIGGSETRADQSPLRSESRDSGYERSSQEEGKYTNGKKDRHQGSPVRLGMIIGDHLQNPDPATVDEMEKKKEKILLLSLRRKEQQEELRLQKEKEIQQRRDEERRKEEEKQRKKEEEKNRKAAILEQFKYKKAMEDPDKDVMPDPVSSRPVPKLRTKSAGQSSGQGRVRPKTIHIDTADLAKTTAFLTSKGARGSGLNLADSSSDLRREGSFLRRQGSNASLHESAKNNRFARDYSGHTGRKDSTLSRYGRSTGSVQNSREDLHRGSNTSLNDGYNDGYRVTPVIHSGRRGSNGIADADSGVGRVTPPRGTLSSTANRLQSPTGPGSLPSGLVSKRRNFDDGASDVSSNPSTGQDYIGPKLYKQPAARSNRSIILNAVEYCVFPGAVNRDAKQRVLEEIARSDSKNFLVLFRDSACQFRALYSYCPDREEIVKLYGTGPRQVNETMFDKFFKYNSGGKCFSQVHTKHLTVTIDAFTIHPSLWQGKRPVVPSRKDAPFVI